MKSLTTEATFHHGVLEPHEPLRLKEGEEVKITIIPVARMAAVPTIELPRWPGKVVGNLTRKEIYADL